MLSLIAGRSFVKIGAMVFLCHDINDIFLEAAKMARYAQQKTAPNVLFVAFMLSWFASRIFYFPVYLIRSVYYEPIEVRCMQRVRESCHNDLVLAECLLSAASCRLPAIILQAWRYAALTLLSLLCKLTSGVPGCSWWQKSTTSTRIRTGRSSWRCYASCSRCICTGAPPCKGPEQMLPVCAQKYPCQPVRDRRSYLIMKVVVKQIRNGAPDDVREDDD